MSDAVIFLARSLGLCHSHFPSVMSLRRSCLVTLWCHISSADGSPSPLQHGHRCHNWSPEWISKVASLIRMSPSYPARGFNGLGWSNPSLRHPGDSGRSVWLIPGLCRLNNLVQLQFLSVLSPFSAGLFFWRETSLSGQSDSAHLTATGCKSHSRDRADESSCAWRSVTLFICRIWTLRVSGDRSKHKTSVLCSLSHCVDLVLIVDPRISLWSVLVTKWKKPLGVTEVDETAGVFMQNWLGCSADFVAQSFSF